MPAEEAEAETEAKRDESPAAKEPETPPPTAPAAEQVAEPSRKVEAPAKAAAAGSPSDQPLPPAPPGADEETFHRVLEEQLGKGLARPIAESRARAAAIKTAREKADAG
jgi:hypothetical protein